VTDKRVKHSEELAARVATLYVNGTGSVRDIAEQEGIPRSTVYTMLERVGVSPNRKDNSKPDIVAQILYEITVEQEQIIAEASQETERLRSVLDTGD